MRVILIMTDFVALYLAPDRETEKREEIDADIWSVALKHALSLQDATWTLALLAKNVKTDTR